MSTRTYHRRRCVEQHHPGEEIGVDVVCKVGRKLLFQLIVQHGGVSVLHGGVVVLHGGVGVLTHNLLRRGEGHLQKVNGMREGHGTQTRLNHDSLNLQWKTNGGGGRYAEGFTTLPRSHDRGLLHDREEVKDISVLKLALNAQSTRRPTPILVRTRQIIAVPTSSCEDAAENIHWRIFIFKAAHLHLQVHRSES